MVQSELKWCKKLRFKKIELYLVGTCSFLGKSFKPSSYPVHKRTFLYIWHYASWLQFILITNYIQTGHDKNLNITQITQRYIPSQHWLVQTMETREQCVKYFSHVFIVGFEQIIIGWEFHKTLLERHTLRSETIPGNWKPSTNDEKWFFISP